MTLAILVTLLAGVLVGLSRQLNGRLSLSTSALGASFWNHLVGFVGMTILSLALGRLLVPWTLDAPWYAYLGGPVGVLFVTASSWAIGRIGALNTALLIITGQMVCGLLIDILREQISSSWLGGLGVALIITGILVSRRGRAR